MYCAKSEVKLINKLNNLPLLSVLMTIFPGGPVLAGTRMSPFWILLDLKMTEVVSGDNWSYKTCKAPVKASAPKKKLCQSVFIMSGRYR